MLILPHCPRTESVMLVLIATSLAAAPVPVPPGAPTHSLVRGSELVGRIMISATEGERTGVGLDIPLISLVPQAAPPPYWFATRADPPMVDPPPSIRKAPPPSGEDNLWHVEPWEGTQLARLSIAGADALDT